MGILGEEAVPGMDRIHIADFRRGDDLVNLQVAVDAASRSDAVSFVGECDVHRIGVRFAVDGNRLNSHFATGANDAKGNLTTVGNQNLLKHGYTDKGSRLVDGTCRNK